MPLPEENNIHHQLPYFLSVWSFWERQLLDGGGLQSSMGLLTLEALSNFGEKTYGTKTPHFNELADRMNFVINQKLAKIKPKPARALRIFYLEPKQDFSENLKTLKINRRAFYYRIKEAKKWLSIWIEQDRFFQDYL